MADQPKERYPWYEPATGDKLEQGDFIDQCRIFIPSYTFSHLVGEITEINNIVQLYDVVVINQTCDLQSKAPLPYILVCPRWTYNEVVGEHPDFSTKGRFEEVRKGKQLRYFMLNRCSLPVLKCDIQIVDLSKGFMLPYDIMKEFVQSKGERIRLCSPYKEKLAQAYAYYYMRVASPIDIDEYDNLHPDQ